MSLLNNNVFMSGNHDYFDNLKGYSVEGQFNGLFLKLIILFIGYIQDIFSILKIKYSLFLAS